MFRSLETLGGLMRLNCSLCYSLPSNLSSKLKGLLERDDSQKIHFSLPIRKESTYEFWLKNVIWFLNLEDDGHLVEVVDVLLNYLSSCLAEMKPLGKEVIVVPSGVKTCSQGFLEVIPCTDRWLMISL